MDELQRLMLEMNARGLSKKTKKSYLSFTKDFLAFIKKNPENVQTNDIKTYLSHIITKRNYTNITANLAISSLKFFFQNIMNSQICDNISRPKKEKNLPTVLSKKEIKTIIESTSNLKHKLVVQCLYGLGLRVSELVNLKINDLDFSRKTVKISGKGNKERYVMLPNTLQSTLEQYISLAQPKTYVFSGRTNKYTVKSVQKIVETAVKKTNIKKKVSCHTLRHSFATHLLENGVDIRYIQKLLGHSQLQTTQIYTHIANKSIKNIKSPLDEL